MMQPAGGMVQPPPMDQQAPPQQQWGMMQQPPPQVQYHPAQQPPMWNQQASQVPPPQSMPMAPPPPQMQPQQFQPQPVPQYAAPAPAPASQPVGPDEIRSLWIGDLQNWMDENYLYGCFAQTGEVTTLKIIRNKQTGLSEGYGFVEFTARAAAERVLQTYNGQMMPNAEQTFRLNWAAAGERRGDDGPDYTIFVGDLSSDVTDYMLQETFRTHYPSVKGAKVVTDRATGRSKGYGFVRFGDLNEQARAMSEMNGAFCSTRPMRIGPAANKKTTIGAQQLAKAPYQTSQGTESENDPNNTTIFVGALDPNVSEDLLRQVFGQYGELVHVKIPIGKRCGFVQFASRSCAEEALLMLNGTQLGGQNVRLSWGRSPSNKQQHQQDPNQWNGSYYGYGQTYDTYGYGPPAQDPNMYAYAAYPGYGNYQPQQ